MPKLEGYPCARIRSARFLRTSGRFYLNSFRPLLSFCAFAAEERITAQGEVGASWRRLASALVPLQRAMHHLVALARNLVHHR